MDLDKYRLTPEQLAKFKALPEPERLAKPKRDWFIRGPLPGHWWSVTASLSLSAVRLALAIWCEAGMRKSRTVKLSAEMRRRFSVTHAERGLADLEQAGLVRVERQRGKRPAITILEVAERAEQTQPR